jgi:hypothetical protein
MYKFHHIPTDKYQPISHDNSYLFTHYDKVSNFLSRNLEKNYKSILAKPIQSGFSFDWFSVFEGLQDINDLDPTFKEAGLVSYWQFKTDLNSRIKDFSNSTDEDQRNWASLLSKVFNENDNYIFSNRNEIVVVWGWKFDNVEIYKPNLVSGQMPSPAASNSATAKEELEVSPENISTSTEIDDPILDSTYDDEISDEYIVRSPDTVEPEKENNKIDKLSFLGFLKWFAGTYWWLLWLLTFLTALVFTIKALKQ